MGFAFGPRRAKVYDVLEWMGQEGNPLQEEELAHLEAFDLIYRSLCAVMFNYVPASGHPGGSISSGRIVTSLLYGGMDCDLSDPIRPDADLLSYAAGHKALGLYAMLALRTEVARLGAPELLPAEDRLQLRMEDLLGFRRNPVTQTPLFRKLRAKALDGHPTPATPFVSLSTGASGVGVASSLGLAFGARDYYGLDAPRVHLIEGEGGLTPGRVVEALAAAGTASLDNAFLHLDWNQASIDTNRVCRDGAEPGDYVQWDPSELFYLHDWNVIQVQDGFDFQQVVAAQQLALSLESSQPTAVIYRTIKGWRYGVEGRLSHGAGHKVCSDGFQNALEPLLRENAPKLPTCCDLNAMRCSGQDGARIMEECFWESLGLLREELASRRDAVAWMAERLRASRTRLDARERKPRENAPDVEVIYATAARETKEIPEKLQLTPGRATTLRGELGNVLDHYNRLSGGAILVAAADLLGSTSINKAASGFEPGYFNAFMNSEARTLSIGGICEDAMAGVFSGVAAYGRHIGAASSYAAFIAPLGHIAARLHAIGSQARRTLTGEAYHPMFLVCAHAGLKTGEDGPTHADPQALQLLQENFPPGTMITLTPWDPQEMWPLVTASLAQRPAVIAPFVTRPNETIPDREKLGLPPATDSVQGVVALRRAKGKGDGTLVLQGSGVTLAFMRDVLPQLDEEGVDLNIFYVASLELFDALPIEERERIFPEERAQEAMGITGFTLPTLYRWVRSDRGRRMSLHPFLHGHYLGSGQAAFVLAEAGLDADGQMRGVRRYLEQVVRVH